EDTTEPELARIKETLENQNFAREARKVLLQIDEEINSIGYDQKKHDDLKEKVSELKNAEEDHKQLAVARSALDPLNDEITDLKTRLDERESSVASQKENLDKQIAVLAVKEAESPSVKEAQDEVLKLQLEENKLRAEVGGARQKVEVLKTLKQRKADAKEEKEALNQQISHYKQLERAFSKDGVPALLIEQALPQIEEKANQILEKLTSGSMNVRFVTQRDYKDKSREDRRETL
ncbi:hypothetical protein GWN75_14540, partial [candidate division KSB1 bacterium]|nr:hypothetical protein [candidate division KSB1 bacterium]NIS25029.1 hypothetical protein [candidate division KSB1 bacterium]NIU25714.1 hypothetical protein [candidate division KSB1 bacterium]NIW19560.1 hypothetical protein [candidate division KSB1 bacterium]